MEIRKKMWMGVFFLNTVYNPFVQPSSTLLAWFIGSNHASPSCLHKGVVLMGLLSGICRLLRVSGLPVFLKFLKLEIVLKFYSFGQNVLKSTFVMLS